MTKYFLTIFAEHKFTDEQCMDIGLSLGTIVDSNFLNFNFSEHYIIFHFESEVNKSEIYSFIIGTLHGISNTFILTEMNDNVSVLLPSKINFMFDLENGGCEMIQDNKYVVEDDEYDEYEISDGIMDNFYKNPTKYDNKYSMDLLLDKINESGLTSLTNEEKKFLEKCSKNLI